MKYGLLSYKKSTNIGDALQTYAIEMVYKKMGISPDDIVFIPLEELNCYDGEYVILPMNSFSHEQTLHLSHKIFPIYIGYNNTIFLNEENKAFLKKNEPIGCRDEYTFKNMQQANIESYISGCYTLSLDKRITAPKEGKYYFIDTPPELESYIPADIKKRSIYLSHILDTSTRSKYDEKDFYQYAINRLEEYKANASVVVTSRLHCASPCLASGIPVIIVKQNIDMNLSWIDKYLPIYEEKNFYKINWYPQEVDLESTKELMIKILKNLIEKKYEEKNLITQLSYAYEIRNRVCYNSRLLEKLKKTVSYLGNDSFSYAIWGAGPGGFMIYQMICDIYPKANLKYMIDRYKKGDFFHTSIISPDDINNYKNIVDYIFICTYSGRVDAVTTLEKIGLVREKNYTFLLSKEGKQDKYYDGY